MLSKITSWRHSKVLAFVLAVAVFLMAFYAISPVISFADGNDSTETIGYWEGTTKPETKEDAFADQLAVDPTAGTIENNPLLITDGAQLYFATKCAEELYFKLTKDIQLQSDENMDDLAEYIETGTAPAGVTFNNWNVNTKHTVKAHIDGDFHTVTGLYVQSGSTSGNGANYGHGFIGNAGGTASVKNLTIDGAYITAKTYVAGIIGSVRGSGANVVIDGCAVINSRIHNANNTSTDAGRFAVAGIVAAGYQGTSISVSNCVVYNTQISNANAENSDYTTRCAGILGDSWGPTVSISNSFVVGYKTYNKTSSDIVTNYTNVYTTESGSRQAVDGTVPTVIIQDNMKGAAAYDNMKGFTPAHGWIVKEAEGYPIYVGAENVKNYTYEKPVWTGVKTFTVEDLAIGTDGKYKISTGAELYGALQNTDADKTFDIINDIYLNTANSDDNNWELWQKYREGTENAFTGTINGNGYTIYGYQDYTDTQGFSNNFLAKRGLGFIPVASNVTIKNLHFSDVSIDAWSAQGTGILIGTATGAVNIEGCSVINAAVEARLVASAFVGTLKENASADIKESVFGSGTLNENRISGDVFSVGAFVAKAADGTTINLTDVVSNGYKVVGAGGTVTPTRAYAIGNGVGTTGVDNYSTFEGLKYQLRAVASVELSDNFYWDNVNKDTSPLLKNRIATKDKDIDGDGDTNLDKQDAAALANIVLFATTDKPAEDYVTLSDGTTGYNDHVSADLIGIDITDVVYIYAN